MIRGAVRLALGPVLLMQGAGVRRRILRMPEAEGPRTGVLGEGPEMSLLILGDSSAAGVGAATQDTALAGQLVGRLAQTRRVRWQVLAQTGWTTQDGLEAMSDLAGRFDAAVLALGVNDVTTETGLTAWLALYRRLLDRLAQDHGVERILLTGLPPMGRFPALPQPLRWYLGLQAGAHDRALADLAATTPGATHLRLDLPGFGPEASAEDGFHPGPPIYAEWARIACDALADCAARAADIA